MKSIPSNFATSSRAHARHGCPVTKHQLRFRSSQLMAIAFARYLGTISSSHTVIVIDPLVVTTYVAPTTAPHRTAPDNNLYLDRSTGYRRLFNLLLSLTIARCQREIYMVKRTLCHQQNLSYRVVSPN
jgi:hypothetical protein